MTSLLVFVLRWPRTFAIGFALTTIAAAAGLSRSWTDVGYRVFLGADHPAIRSLDGVIERYGGGLPVLIAWECGPGLPCAHALDDTALPMARALEESLLDHPLIRSVASPASADVLIPADGSIAVRHLLEDGEIPRDIGELVEAVHDDPLWLGTLLSVDGSVGAIVVQLGSTESRASAEVVPFIRSLLTRYENEGHRFYLVGDPIDFVVSGGQMQADTPPIMAALVAVLVGTSWLLLRSWRAVLLALVTAAASLVWAMGAMAWLGWPEMELTQALRPGILVVVTCDAVHLITRYSEKANASVDPGPDERRIILADTAREVLVPCLLTSLTTFVAFLSFVLSGSEAFVRFGVVAAFGVAVAFVLTFTALPLAMQFIHPRALGARNVHGSWRRFLDRLIELSSRKHRLIVLTALAVVCASAIGMLRLRIDLSERELLGETSLVSRWAYFVEQNLRKSDSLELVLQTPEGVSFLEPDALQVIGDVAAAISDLDSIGRGRSVLDLFSALNRALHDGSDAYFRSSDSEAGNAELLLLLEMGGSASSSHWLYEEGEARISFEADAISTSERLAILNEIEAILSSRLTEGWSYEATGPFAVYLAFADVIQRTQLSSFGSAFLVIAAILFAYSWSRTRDTRAALRWCAIAMLPSVVPVVLILGLMGLLDIPLDVGTAMVGAIVIGIAVDDSIHLIANFHAARRWEASDRTAIATAIRKTGQAVITTSVALSVGFFALTLSSWQSIASFGLLSGLAIIIALIADLLLLPALVIATSRDPAEADHSEHTVTGIPGRGPRGVVTACSLMLAAAVSWPLAGALRAGDRGPALGCDLEASGRVVSLSSLSPDCPLAAGQLVQSISLDGASITTRELTSGFETPPPVRTPLFQIADPVAQEGAAYVRGVPSGSRSSIDLLLALLLVLLATAGGAIVIWYSASQACLPFALLSVSTSGLVALVVSPAATSRAVLPFCLALATFTASTLHLGLSFPRRSRIMEEIPGLWWLIYLCGAMIGAAALWGSVRHPVLFRAAIALATSSAGLVVARLLVHAGQSSRGRDPLDDVRARTAAAGMVVVALVVGSLWFLPNVNRTVTTAVALVAALVPVGYALIRHQQLTSRAWWRRASERFITAIIYVPLVIAFMDWFDHGRASGANLSAERLFAVAVFGLLFALACRLVARILVRWYTGDAVDRATRLELEASERLESAIDQSEVARTLAVTTAEAFRALNASVALVRDGYLSVVAAHGPEPILPTEAVAIRYMLEGARQPIHLGPEGGATGVERELLARDRVCAVAPLRWQEQLIGAVFVGASSDGFPYSQDDLALMTRLCRSGAAVLHQLELQAELHLAERRVTLSSAGSGLMHSVSKPLTIAARSAERLVLRRPRDEEVRTLAAIIRTAANEALSGIDRLRASAESDGPAGTLVCPVEELIDRAIEHARQIQPSCVVVKRLSADLPLVDHGDELRRMVTSLLDNALHATRVGDTSPEVRVHTRTEGLLIEVVDFGVGMAPDVLARATQPFFTTRRASGGSGIGLMDVVSTTERLGGTFALESAPGRGTTARICLPYADDRARADPDAAPRLASGQR